MVISKNFLKDKRGDKLLSIYWFAILIIVAGGIFAMVYLFYGSPYDVREIEANLLINRIADCISYSGRINSFFISGVNADNFLKQCHLNFSSSDFDEEQYYAKVIFYKLEDLEEPFLNFVEGNSKWSASCALQEDKQQKKLAWCEERKFYSIDELDNQYVINILVAVRKSEKNVKL